MRIDEPKFDKPSSKRASPIVNDTCFRHIAAIVSTAAIGDVHYDILTTTRKRARSPLEHNRR
jgi:hypothetical protein